MATILVVDDEPAIRALVRAALAEHDVIEAADGPSGIEAASTGEPDLILLDIALPGMSGLEVCRRLRASPATSRVPVLVLTGLDTPTPAPGTDGWIAKPFSPQGIVERVDDTLRHAQPLSARS
jgi:DNA-binding response OmpR family regulator